MSYDQELLRTLCLRRGEHLGCQCSAALYIAVIVVKVCETKLGDAKAPGIASGFAQSSRTRIRSLNLGMPKASVGDKGPAEKKLERHLMGVSSRTFGLSREQYNRFAKLRDCLAVRRARLRLLAGALVVRNRFVGLPSQFCVPRHHLRLGRRAIGELREQHFEDAAVELAACALEQRLVGCLLYQRMLEGVTGLRRFAAHEQDLRLIQSRQPAAQRRFLQSDHRGEQRIGKFASQY